MTLLGKHTLSELRDLLNMYNFEQDALSKSVQGARDNWIANDPNGFAQWQKDYDAWNAQYQIARDHANTVLSQTSTTLQSVTTDEDTYQELAKAFLPFGDFDRRMRAGPSASAAPTYQGHPVPTAADADLSGYKSLDVASRGMPDVAKAVVANIAPGLIPQTADKSSYTSKQLTTTQKVLLAAGAFLGLALFVKVAK